MIRRARSKASKTTDSSKMQRSASGHKDQRAKPQPPSPLIEGNHHMRHIDRAPPGDIVRRASKARPREDLARQKSKRMFFEDAFSTSTASPARERVHGDAIVMAEVKTNIIVRDEFTLITDLACQLATRYRRPVSSVVVTLHQGACMLFAGTLDPAYAMVVRALPSQLRPATNKRNAALLQRHMEDALGVPPHRGILRFVPVPEEHLACGGRTVAGEIEELERADGGVRGEGGEGGGRDYWRDSLAALRIPPTAGMVTPEPTPPGSADGELPSMPGSYPKTTPEVEPGKKAAHKRRSFVATIFGLSGSKSSDRSSLLAILDEAPKA
ncbi:Tautomerase/MIF superfamily [Corynascus novoguineensis]|uniref:L-dopachrome isomerase n=1 Tax=Corynascus novoguineensis TaxID=1126955 RepID=A0AAN7D2C1_9PEZI|nr:Tautomerase/MIF superfamily [Corynascus novoguineensis]